jgi:hypothetical protein
VHCCEFSGGQLFRGVPSPQPVAQRLWGLDESACLQLLEFLVDAPYERRAERASAEAASAKPKAIEVKVS